jgi:hypothetical protein
MLFVKANAQMFNFSGLILLRKGDGLDKWLIVAHSLHVLLQVGYFCTCLHLGVFALFMPFYMPTLLAHGKLHTW